MARAAKLVYRLKLWLELAGEDGPVRRSVEQALSQFLSKQSGGYAVLTLSRLERFGFNHSSAYQLAVLNYMLERGVRDPLGRGIWVLERVERGSRKKYHLALKPEQQSGGGVEPRSSGGAARSKNK